MAIQKKFKLQAISLDVNEYEKILQKEMKEEIIEAARDWLRTVISIVPVWSRASHATFKPLADAVGFVIPTFPLIAAKDRSSLGESVSVGKLELDKNKFFFVYETSLRYLGFNEFNRAEFPDAGIFSPAGLKTPTPFNFTGRAAEQFMRATPEIPNPLRALKVRRI